MMFACKGLSKLYVLIFWQTVIKGVVLIVAVTFNEKILVSEIGRKMSGPGKDTPGYSAATSR